MQLSKGYILNLLCLLVSCKIDAQIDFFDKKYFRGYTLDADSKMPLFSYFDTKIGSISVYYLAKTEILQREWYNYDSKNHIDYEGEVPDNNYYNRINALIKKKLEPDMSNYYCIAENIPARFIRINKKDGEIEYKFPFLKKFYIYNKEIKKWEFLTPQLVLVANEDQ